MDDLIERLRRRVEAHTNSPLGVLLREAADALETAREVLEHVRDGMEASGGWDGDEHVFELVVAAIAALYQERGND